VNKQNHKLEDLLRAAREESPVVSFSETAEQITRLEALSQQGSRRRGLVWWWEKAFAFPRTLGQHVGEIANMRFPTQPVLTSFSARLAGGMAFVAAVVVLFPHLTHDGAFPRIVGSEKITPVPTEQGAYMTVQKDVAQKFSKNVYKNTSQGSSQLASLPFLAASDSSHKEANTLSQNVAQNSTQAASEQPSPQILRTLIGQAPPSAERSVVIATEQPLQNTPQAAPEEAFWKRLSLEARVATRSALAPAASASTLSPADATSFRSAQQLASESASPLQNIALGVMFALDEHHSIGIEGGTEPFLSAVRAEAGLTQTGTGSLATNSMDSTRSLATGAPTFVATSPVDKSQNLPRNVQTTETRNRAWFGAAYQYNFAIIEALGGVQPIARLTVGGGEIGVVGRTIIGARFLPQNQVSVLLAGEGAGIASPNPLAANSAWNFTPKVGLTLGLSVKF
jgi:hypothetical protein